MPRRPTTPVSVAGIEFPAMLDETQTYTSSIPDYPVETGFTVSDSIIIQPMELPLTLLLSDTPLTWRGRVRSMAEAESMLKELYFSKTPFSVTTPSGTFDNMGITSMSIKRSTETGYKEVSLSLKQIPVTESKTTTIPDSYGKSGATGANAGTASTSTGSTGGSSSSGSSGGGVSGGSKSSSGGKSGSILYNLANSAGLL